MKNTKADLNEIPYVFREGRDRGDLPPELFDGFSGSRLARIFNSKNPVLENREHKEARK
jgi:hypothetical protein